MPSRIKEVGRCWLGLGLLTLAGACRAAEGLPPKPVVAPPLDAAPTQPLPPASAGLLRPGERVILRILQVIPADGLSPAERVLNSLCPLRAGDRFLAEVLKPHTHGPVLLAGRIAGVTAPGWFGRQGYIRLELAQLVENVNGESRLVPWQFDTRDRRPSTRLRRVGLDLLLAIDGAIFGAAAGAQRLSGPAGVYSEVGAAIGFLVGLGYSSFQRDVEPTLEPGDTFQVTAGTTCFRPLPREWETILYPACDATARRGKRK